mgnify:FL=1
MVKGVNKMNKETIIFMFVILVGLFILNLIYGKLTRMELGEIIAVTIAIWVMLMIAFLIVLFGTMWCVR